MSTERRKAYSVLKDKLPLQLPRTSGAVGFKIACDTIQQWYQQQRVKESGHFLAVILHCEFQCECKEIDAAFKEYERDLVLKIQPRDTTNGRFI